MIDERLRHSPRIIAALAVLFVHFALAMGAPAHGEDNRGLRHRMAGTYYLQVGTDPFVFDALMLLTPDGGLVAEADGGARFPNADLSATLGAWRPINGKRRARMRFFLFDISGDSAEITETLARNRVTLIAEFSQNFDEFNGSFVIEAFSPEQDPLSGEVPAFGTIEGSLSARRIVP
jgi:hypothetical protein